MARQRSHFPSFTRVLGDRRVRGNAFTPFAVGSGSTGKGIHMSFDKGLSTGSRIRTLAGDLLNARRGSHMAWRSVGAVGKPDLVAWR
jgi:hypothetical protein